MYSRCRTRNELSREITRLATSWRVDRWVITNFAVSEGLRVSPWKPWTDEEIEVLRNRAGEISLKKLAKTLQRSPESVKHQLLRMKLSSAVTEGYSLNQLQQLLGVQYRQVHMWVGRQWLLMENNRITEKSLKKFLFHRMDAYSFRNCDEVWLKGMLNPRFGLKANVRDKEASGDHDEDVDSG